MRKLPLLWIGSTSLVIAATLFYSRTESPSPRAQSTATAASAPGVTSDDDVSENASTVEGSIAATYENIFRCTVYYTPREQGFTADRGFDLRPTTKPGLKGRTFSSDFLKAVALEGFGRMSTPFEGKQYLRCCRGEWGFACTPLDCRGQPLRPRETCAIAAPHQLVRPNARLHVLAAGMSAQFGAACWKVTDTGSGLAARQLDLYWGEDDPLGPNRQLSKPRSMPETIIKPAILVLR